MDGVEYVVAYASKNYDPAEKICNSFDRECLAVMLATTHFKQYLFGNSFTLVTDHKPLRSIMTTQKLTGKLARWCLMVQEQDFTVLHRAGMEVSNADCLSKHPLRATHGAPISDWSRGDYNEALASYLAMMVSEAASPLLTPLRGRSGEIRRCCIFSKRTSMVED